MQKESPNHDKPGLPESLVGRILARIALVFCFPVGAFFVSVATDFVGITLGVVGCWTVSKMLSSGRFSKVNPTTNLLTLVHSSLEPSL